MEKRNAKALLPIAVFVVLYLGLGILFEYGLNIEMGFYKIPVVIIFLLALLVACLQNRKLSLNDKLKIMGVGISSIICQGLALIICIKAFKKHIKLEFDAKRMIILPVIISSVMGICTYFINKGLNTIMGQNLSTIISIILGAIIYVILVFVSKILKKEDIMMIPFGTKIYNILVKLKVYKEEI